MKHTGDEDCICSKCDGERRIQAMAVARAFFHPKETIQKMAALQEVVKQAVAESTPAFGDPYRDHAVREMVSAGALHLGGGLERVGAYVRAETPRDVEVLATVAKARSAIGSERPTPVVIRCDSGWDDP